jgi:hypothetical protein
MEASIQLARLSPPSLPLQRPGRWRSYCCPLHLAAGFAASREPCLPMAQDGAAADAPGAPAATPPALGDATPKERTEFCRTDAALTAGLFQTLAPSRALVLRQARVITMQGGAVLPEHDVVLRDGLIESVRPSSVPPPPDAELLDARGKTVIPGLSDIHAHLFVKHWGQTFAPILRDGGGGSAWVLPYELQLLRLLACGITRVEVMAGCPDGLWMRDGVREGRLAGPRLSVGSPLIDGQPLFHSALMSYSVGSFEGGQRAGELLCDMGFDFAKPYSNLPADGYDGLMQVLQRRGKRVMGHVPITVGVEAAVKRGQQGIAHVAELFYNEKGPERKDAARRDRLLRLMAEHGTWLQATVVVSRRMEWMGGHAPLHSPDRAHMNPMQRALWAEDSPMLAGMRANTEKAHYFDEAFRLSAEATRAAHALGVKVLTGTDFPNPHVVDGYSLHEELELLVGHCGHTPAEALHASTRRAAEYHGEGPADGCVAAGGRAELVVLDADPLADITATRRIHAVLSGRHLMRPEHLRATAERINAAYDAMPPAVVQLPTQHEYLAKDS